MCMYLNLDSEVRQVASLSSFLLNVCIYVCMYVCMLFFVPILCRIVHVRIHILKVVEGSIGGYHTD